MSFVDPNGFLFTVQEELSTMMQKIRWAILILCVIVLMTAIVQNSDPVTLKLFRYQADLPTSILLLVVSVASFLFGAATTARILRRRDTAKKLANSPGKSPTATTPSAPETSTTPPTTERKNPLT
jgi:uncharacterized integral membrane protein